jgi:hypothetical protein
MQNTAMEASMDSGARIVTLLVRVVVLAWVCAFLAAAALTGG